MPHSLPDGPLVSAEWLQQHQNECLILDCSVARYMASDGSTQFAPGQDLFLQQHIRGAQFADLFKGFSATNAPLPFTAPDTAELSAALRQCGVNQHSNLILYDQLGGAYAARVWFLLFVVHRFARVRVLDGGWRAWLEQGGEQEQGPARSLPMGNIKLAAARAVLLSTADVAAAPPPLLCALRSESFQRQHIPGSVNLPWPELLDERGRIDIARVFPALQQLGLADASSLLLYCGGGINAAGVALALTAAGFPLQALRLYDDSLNGWLKDGDRPTTSGTGLGIYQH